MSNSKGIKQKKGVLGKLSGTSTPIQISKNGVIQISKKLRSIAKK